MGKKDDLRTRLPYGKWTCADGREVFFNRYYKPIWERMGSKVSVADPDEWVKWVKQEWFYDDLTTPYPLFYARGNRKTRKLCEDLLIELGLCSLNETKGS